MRGLRKQAIRVVPWLIFRISHPAESGSLRAFYFPQELENLKNINERRKKMKSIYVSDITLGGATGAKSRRLSFREKLALAQSLHNAGIDCVELPACSGSREDEVVLRTIASSLNGCTVSIPTGVDDESLDAAWSCVKTAESPCLRVEMPVSTVQMEYTYHMKAPKMLEKIAYLCKKASEKCDIVEFVAADATRAEAGFAAECCRAACENGASRVTLCDDAGTGFPDEIAALVSEVKQACDGKVFVKTSDMLNMAAACAVEAIKAGADGIKTAVGSKLLLSAEVFADICRAKGDELGFSCGLDITGIHRMLSEATPEEAEKQGENASAQAEPSVLNASSTLTQVIAAVRDLGYELSAEDNGKVYEEFRRVAAKKNSISARELEAIVASTAMQVPSTYHIVSYVVNSGNVMTATANLTLEKNGEKLSGVSTGDGPIDAAFHAIEQIIGHHYELDDFQIQAITKGREALGSSLIRLRDGGKLYAGNGISTDIVGACIRAYINALNKIVYEEK